MTRRFQVTRAFISAVKMSDLPAYEIAHRAGMHPSTLSKLIIGFHFVRPADNRAAAVATVLGMPPEECIEPVPEPVRELA